MTTLLPTWLAAYLATGLVLVAIGMAAMTPPPSDELKKHSLSMLFVASMVTAVLWPLWLAFAIRRERRP